MKFLWTLIGLVWFVIGCGKSSEPDESQKLPLSMTQDSIQLTEKEIEAIGIEFGVVAHRSFAVELRIAGQVFIPPSGRAVMAAPISGRAVSVFANAGDQVTLGQVLARIYSPDLQQRILDGQAVKHESERNLRILEHAVEHVNELKDLHHSLKERQISMDREFERISRQVNASVSSDISKQVDIVRDSLRELDDQIRDRERLLKDHLVTRQEVTKDKLEQLRFGIEHQLSLLRTEQEGRQSKVNLDQAMLSARSGLEGVIAQVEAEILRAEEELASRKAEYAKSQADRQLSQLRAEAYAIEVVDHQVVVPIRATVSGELLLHQVIQGSQVQEGVELFQIVNKAEAVIVGRVPASSRSGLEINTPAQLDIPGHGKVESIVTYISPVLDPDTQSYIIYLKLPQLIPFLGEGTPVGVYLALVSEDRLTLPIEAVDEGSGATFVYRFDGIDSFYKTPVKIGLRNSQWVEILEGVEENRRIVSKGWHYIRNLMGKGSGLPPGAHIHPDGTIHYGDH